MSAPTQETKAGLTKLLKAVPGELLRIQPIAPGKPAIYAGQNPVVRYRDSQEGEAYAELIVAAVNALPGLLGGSPAPEDDEEREIPVRARIESVIAKSVLALHPDFKAVSAKLLTKLIFSAIEPLLFHTQESYAAPVGGPSDSVIPKDAKELRALRLTAVEDFCTYLLQRADTHDIPSEDALTVFVTNWDNSSRPDPRMQEAG